MRKYFQKNNKLLNKKKNKENKMVWVFRHKTLVKPNRYCQTNYWIVIKNKLYNLKTEIGESRDVPVAPNISNTLDFMNLRFPENFYREIDTVYTLSLSNFIIGYLQISTGIMDFTDLSSLSWDLSFF